MKLLLAEDERDLSAAVKKILEVRGFSVDCAFDGEEALAYLKSYRYDAAILDVMMPKLDGISVVKRMRFQGDSTPVLILTAKAETDDKVLGLDSGADDYLTKPFVVKELIARVKALTRRRGEVMTSFTFGNLTLNGETHEMRAEKSVRLTGREYDLMEYFLKNKNAVLSTERILLGVWDVETEAEINVVWVFISSLRKKMKEIGANVRIAAARGVGYRLELEKTDD